MEENQNIVPNEQNPMPQKEEEKKKKNKFVAWWVGLSKWAKVGVCAGTAAVLATAITLPIVLSPKGETYEIVWSDENNCYRSKDINLKKNVLYTFKCTLLADKYDVQNFQINLASEGTAKMTYAKLEGNGAKWDLYNDDCAFGNEGEHIKGPAKFNIKIKVSENCTNCYGTLAQGGA